MDHREVYCVEQLKANERIDTIDILRGFAVFGICFVNMPEMFGNGVAFVTGTTGFDAVVRLLYDMFIQTKFYTLFAFLFGLSFYLFMNSAERRGAQPRRMMARRLVWLLVFGTIHFFFIWFGDILMMYALSGFLLLLFYRRQAKTILAWSLSLLALAVVLMAGTAWITATLSPELLEDPIFTAIPGLQERIDYFITQGLPSMIVYLPEILGLYLLGMYAGKRGWFSHTTGEGLTQRTLARAQWISLAVSVVFLVPMVMYFMNNDVYKSYYVQHYIYLSGKTLAVFYVCTLVRLIQVAGTVRWAWLAAVGRMAFTNYLTQSIVTMSLVTVLFRNTPDWPLWSMFVYSVVLLAIQVAWSVWWLRRYTMGPLESLWRAGTYLQRPTLTPRSASTETQTLGA